MAVGDVLDPYEVTPGATYVISYTPPGHYSATSNDFTVNRTWDR